MKNLFNNTILIVDDTPENIDILVDLLEDFDKQIAINGADALETAWEDKAPDLILLDIMMPDMDGYEVCKRLRANKKTKDVPVIFLTAKTQKDDIVKGFEVGGQDYITKPFDARELMERVKTQLELKTQREILKNMNNILEEKVEERTAQLDKANKELMELDNAKNEFLKLISHEIRTPLNGIIGSTYFLSESIEDPEMKDFLEMLKESVDRLDKFSKTALELTQMQTRGSEMPKEPINLNQLIEEVCNEYEEEAASKEVRFKLNLETNVEIIAVEEYTKRALTEVIGNAIKFSEKGNEVIITTTTIDNKLHLSVADTGEVIPPEKIEEIVKPFGLAKEHYDKNIGLGLALVQLYLELHDGSLNIVSNEENTTFSLIFDI